MNPMLQFSYLRFVVKSLSPLNLLLFFLFGKYCQLVQFVPFLGISAGRQIFEISLDTFLALFKVLCFLGGSNGVEAVLVLHLRASKASVASTFLSHNNKR